MGVLQDRLFLGPIYRPNNTDYLNGKSRDLEPLMIMKRAYTWFYGYQHKPGHFLCYEAVMTQI